MELSVDRKINFDSCVHKAIDTADPRSTVTSVTNLFPVKTQSTYYVIGLSFKSSVCPLMWTEGSWIQFW